MSFKQLGLCKDLLGAVALAGYEIPTDIQARAIPVIFKGQDLLAQSKTGSGKTASFVLPALQLVEDSPESLRKTIKVLILTPTRELGRQVADVVKIFGRNLARPPRVILLIGGLNIDLQVRNLHHGADIAVATPGRLLDLARRQVLDLAALKLLVVDEADKMFDMGFAQELQEVLATLPLRRQNVLFSATMPDTVLTLMQPFMRDPVTVKVQDDIPTVNRIQQRAIVVNRTNRGPLLRHLIMTEGWGHVLVFVATVQGADVLTVKLRKAGILATSLHGGMTQAQRELALHDFKVRTVKVLVATDIMARGIHIEKLAYVVNYDLPRSPNDYIHRIGRTARAGLSGVAVSFIGHEDVAHFALIEKRIHQRLPREQVPGFELTGEALPRVTGQAPVKGHRMSRKDKARALANHQQMPPIGHV
ncbi:MAG: DEAD/DEAH box helicase [Candidatus Omnitrophota bacterium]